MLVGWGAEFGMLEVGTKDHGWLRSSNQTNKQTNKVPNEERFFGQRVG